MELNIKKAFLSPFSEEKWYIKLIFPVAIAALSFAANIISKEHKLEAVMLGLLSLIPSIILTGFFARFAQNEIKSQTPLLPELKYQIKQYLIYGLKYIGVSLVYTFILLLLTLGVAVLVGITLGLLSAANITTKLLSAIIFILIFIPLVILFIAFMTLVLGAFSDNMSFEEALNIKRVWSLVCKTKAEIAIYLLLAIGLGIALAIISVILIVPKVTIFLVPFFITVEQLISINLKAQVYKIAKSRLI